jgi:hypothetical protein
VVGGYAVMKYTEPRFTKDLDLWIATDAENANGIFAALKEFGAPLKDMTPADFRQEGYFYQMGNPPFRLDVMMSLPGVMFEAAWMNREQVEMEGLTVPFISRKDLIRTKEASGRDQDRIDVKKLRQTGG